MIMQKNDEFVLKIDALTSEGSGIGRKDGMAVFAYGTAPGDTVLAHVIKAKKNYCVAKALQILEPSPDRIENDCPAFPACGGCDFRHISYDAELRYKAERINDAFARIAGTDLKIEKMYGASACASYRNKAQLPFASGKNGVCTGFYASRSHRVVPNTRCRLQDASFDAAAAAVRDWAAQTHASVYDETTGRGLLRHLYMRRACSGDLMVCLVINGKTVANPDLLLQLLQRAVPGLKTLCLNINRNDTNVVLSGETQVLFGDGYIEDVLCGLRFRISPNSFYQVNHDQCEVLYGLAAEFAAPKKNDVLLDLYCGTGTIGLTMAGRVQTLVGIETVSPAVEDARRNAAENGVENALFLCADAAEGARQMAEQGLKPNIIVLDPPRKGCAEDVLRLAASMQPERIVYVSCDPATLARDIARFAPLGYTAVRAAGVDLFPRTKHTETVCLFLRAD